MITAKQYQAVAAELRNQSLTAQQLVKNLTPVQRMLPTAAEVNKAFLAFVVVLRDEKVKAQ